jgi:hypothetical protein
MSDGWMTAEEVLESNPQLKELYLDVRKSARVQGEELTPDQFMEMYEEIQWEDQDLEDLGVDPSLAIDPDSN